MSEGGPGCRKVGLFGCLGLLGLVILIGAIAYFWALSLGNDEGPREATLSAPPRVVGEGLEPGGWDTFATDDVPTRKVGTVVLELSQGGFQVRPAAPGDPTRIDAIYDEKQYELVESREDTPDGWVYTVTFRRKSPALVALIRAMMGDEEPTIDIEISPDEPIALVVHAKQGGIEADLGGLWLTEAEIAFEQGGGEVEFSEPLREPMEHLSLRSRMGGFELRDLAYAGPRRLEVECSMGGAALDLEGDWYRDTDVRLKVRMGGMEVALPEDVEVEGLRRRRGGDRFGDARPEIPRVTMRFDATASMGEIEAR